MARLSSITSSGEPVRRGRGRPPAVAVTAELVVASELSIRRVAEADGVTLKLSGTIDPTGLLELRDVAFTEIGGKPARLFLDTRGLVGSVDMPTAENLMTIGRVARMMGILCTVIAHNELAAFLSATGAEKDILLQRDDSA